MSKWCGHVRTGRRIRSLCVECPQHEVSGLVPAGELSRFCRPGGREGRSNSHGMLRQVVLRPREPGGRWLSGGLGGHPRQPCVRLVEPPALQGDRSQWLGAVAQLDPQIGDYESQT